MEVLPQLAYRHLPATGLGQLMVSGVLF